MVFKLFSKLNSRLSKLVSHFSGIFVVILVILALICLFITQERETFVPGKAGPVHPYQVTEQTSQQLGLPNAQCTPETDCFPGSYLRTEIYHQALKREIKEETNLIVRVSRMILSVNFEMIGLKKKHNIVYYECEISEKRKIILTEGRKYKFFSFNQIKKLNIIPMDFAAIKSHYLTIIKKTTL